MQTYYIVASNDLLHFGKGHDDNPPGRGSGRYAWGSGDAKKRAKNLAIGTERLTNRIERANNLADVDRLSAKTGWKYTQAAGRANDQVRNIKDISNEILNNEDRLAELGRRTKNTRIGTKVAGIGGASLSAIGGAAATAALSSVGPVVLGSAAALAIGGVAYNFYQKTKY
jgi:hypothetical protein